MSQKVLHILVLNFLPLIVTTNPGGGEISLLQNLVSTVVCSVPIRDTIAAGADGAGMFSAVGGALKTPDGAALKSVPCWFY